jgi:hypothetical protein
MGEGEREREREREETECVVKIVDYYKEEARGTERGLYREREREREDEETRAYLGKS